MAFSPICVACAREMRCKKNDYLFGDYERAAIWAGDMFECERCNASVVVGAGKGPVAVKGEPSYAGYWWRVRFALRRTEKKD